VADRERFPRWLIAVLVLVAAATAGGGAWLHRAFARDARETAERELQALAQLKVDQIADWRANQIAEGVELAGSPFFIEGVARWLADPGSADVEILLTRFGTLQEHYGYRDILLLDADRRVRLSLSGRPHAVDSMVVSTVVRAMRHRRPMLTELHMAPGDDTPHLGVVAPLFIGDGDAARPIGAVILQHDAREFLYPLVQSWPLPSQSGETLLVRHDGDAVLFLNDLRHRPDASLRLRIPLDQADVPAVMAMQGHEGAVRGRDYRGVPVLAVIRVVPDSPWYMIAKVDEAEVFAPWRATSFLILMALIGLFGTGVAGMVLVWQRDAALRYRALFRAEAAQRAIEERYHVTLMSVGDAVISTDADGRVEFVNPIAADLIGWPAAEALGRPLEDVFHIVNEETGRAVENPVRRVMREDAVVGLANHTMLVARDGGRRPIADSGAPIRGDAGEITGVVLVFRDQTQEREAQRALRERALERERMLSSMTNALAVFDSVLDADGVLVDARFVYINPAYERLTGVCDDEVRGKRVYEVWPETEPDWFEYCGVVVATGNPRSFEQFHGPTGRLYDCNAYRPGDSPDRFCLLLDDITEQRRAEQEIRALNAELRALNAGLEQRVAERTAQLEAAVEELESFSYSVSHDLRAPLRAIDGYGRILAEDYGQRLDVEGNRVLDVVRAEARRMGRLIDDLLAFSRLGRQMLRTTEVDMTALAQEAYDELRAGAPDRAVEFHLADLPRAAGDPALLRQVWANLLDNALKFTGERNPARIEVSGAVQGREAVYTVRDNGAGFDMAHAGRLFGVFQRLHREDEFEGVGIGLALAQRLIRRHGGRIWAEGALDQGAAFMFTLPLTQEGVSEAGPDS